MQEPIDPSLFPPPPTAAPGTEWGAEPVEEEDADRMAFQAELERVAAEVWPAPLHAVQVPGLPVSATFSTSQKYSCATEHAAA